MLRNNCQCDLCRSVWGSCETRVDEAEDHGVTKIPSAMGNGLAMGVVTMILLICGDLFLANKIPHGLWYSVPSVVGLGIAAAFPITGVIFSIIDALEARYENH